MDEFDTIDDHFARHAKLLMEDPSARFGALRNCSFFKPVPDEWLQRISEMAQIRTFHADISITSQDDDMKAFYVILYGAAEAFRNGKLVGTIETGDCFGEGIFFADGSITASATVIADDKIIVAQFSKIAIAALQADPHAMVSLDKALLLALFKKLKGANQKIERLMLV
ncbi:cyclic nucleotide-binding domain-containing protein [uncultured Ramlibacter sp.]|uniref:cyclic nucleotide-binding domain-containing protein n=1 Tax=uncultured Ramlibacter sp. TaxID=260755 RepID=UPI0026123329|nr:cyclic nucleotide-binding domain-containing protein [uncultured Ramlibacter sp.]